MIATITKSKANGLAFAPPSKSVSHRALICAALGKESIIKGLAMSNDIKATVSCIKKLGASIELLSEDTLKITGIDFENIDSDILLDCNESGSTLRFFIPIALLSRNKVFFTGSTRLFDRPLSVYEQICRAQNLLFEKDGNSLSVRGKLSAGEYNVDAGISSQFISGLLFALPLLENDSVINLSGNIESLPYIQMTLKVMRDYGIKVVFNDNKLYIKGGQEYSLDEYVIEGDYSNAAFLDAFNCFGGDVEVRGLAEDSLQGDKIYIDHLKALQNGFCRISLRDCPDLGPVLFSVAAGLHGAEFTETKRLKIKESDRVEAMRVELEKFGAKLVCEENRVTVVKSYLCTPTESLQAHNDHRIVMALCVLASVYGGKICNAEAVNKSYPNFFETIKQLGIGVNLSET